MTEETVNGASRENGKRDRKSVWIAALTVLAVTLLVFSPICHFQFSSIDDGPNVYLNPYLKNPASQDIGYLWTHTYFDLYMPVTYCLWAMCAHIAPLSMPQPLPVTHDTSALNPSVFHSLSLLFHALNSLLVFAIFRRLRFRPWPGAAGAALFALHPTQVESVAWITGFNNISSGFFCLGALYIYLLAITPRNAISLSAEPSKGDTQTPAKSSLALLALATLCFICGLLSKPTATVLPLFVVILEAVAFRRPLRKWIGVMALWCVLSIASFAATSFATHGNTVDFWSPIWGRPFVAGDALSFYLVKLVLPIHLTFDYGRSPRAVLNAWWGYVDWVLPVLLAVILWRTGRQSTVAPEENRRLWFWLRLAFLFFAAGLVAVLGFVPFYWQPTSTVSDRYLYLAMFGPALAMTAICSDVRERHKRVVGLVVVVILAALVTRTVVQELVWTNAYSLTQDMLEEAPNSAMAQHLAGGILTFQKDYNGALTRLLISKRLEPTEIPATDQDLAYTLVHLNRYPEAVAPLARTIALEPYRNEHWELLWFVISHLQNFNAIEAIMQHRLQINPHDGRAEFTEGVIRLQRENAAAALPDLEAGERDAPDFAEIHLDLGAVYQQLNRPQDARAQYEDALRIDPANTNARSALAGMSLPAGVPRL